MIRKRAPSWGLGGLLSLAGLLCASAPASAGPFDAPSTLPFGFPPFDVIKESDYRPAFAAAMAQQRAEVDAIAHNPEPPTFENTLVALERSGQMLTRLNNVFGSLTSANTNPEHDAIDAEMAPKLAAHADAIYLDTTLFARVNALYERRDALGLDAVSRRLVERYQLLFVRAGARLADAPRQRLRAINEELATLGSRYDQVLLKANIDCAVVVDSRAELAGLPEALVSAAAEAARGRGLSGKWVIALEKPTSQDVLGLLENRTLRERVYRAAAGRGAGGADDTGAIAVQTARLRAEKAALLGYPDWATYVLED